MKYLLTAMLFVFCLLGTAKSRYQAQSSVPVICYHGIYTDPGRKPSVLAISRERFDAQLKSLYDSGYHTVLPDQLVAYLVRGKPLPSKPVVITFDDTRAEHLAIAAPLLEQYGFRGVFFVMTVPIGKPGYITTAGIKKLSDRGHVIGAHTWDHPHLTATSGWNYKAQVIQPREQLQQVTGKPVLYFAYPFGEWNESAISMLQIGGYKAAFKLT